jgi:hypothetical protein
MPTDVHPTDPMSASVAASLNVATNGVELHTHPFVAADVPTDVLPMKNSKLAVPLQSACPIINLIPVGESAAETGAGIEPTANRRNNIKSIFFMDSPSLTYLTLFL